MKTDDRFEVSSTGNEISVGAGGTELLRYNTEPNSPQEEAPKPYLFPLRFTDGAEASIRRPWDHRWHTGLQFTWSHVDDQNFWGGPSFRAEGGYRMEDNLGSMRHVRLRRPAEPGPEVLLDEQLQWITAAGEHWMDEQRLQRVHSLDLSRGIWAIDLQTEITNVRSRTTHLGSPTTAGRPDAGYTGWFWRGPRSWTECQVVSSEGLKDESEIMGTQADWVAFRSAHDDADGGGTIMVHAGHSSSEEVETPPVKWFTRTGIFAVASPSPAFDQEILLPPQGTLRLHHRFVFIARQLDDAELARCGEEFSIR